MTQIFEALELRPYARPRGAPPEGRLDERGDRATAPARPGPTIAARMDLPVDVTMFDPSPFLSRASTLGLF